MGLRDTILAKTELITEKVDCRPDWDCDVWVRQVSGLERDAFEAASLKKVGKKQETNLQNIRARMALLTVCDEAGKPVFQRGDELLIGQLSARALDKIMTVAQRLNGWSEEDVEEMVKN